MLFRPAAAAVAAVAAALFWSGPLASPAQTPAPSPSASAPVPSSKPSRAPAAKETPARIHRAIVDCDLATFYNWPSFDSAPSPSSYPSARMGDAFDVIGDAHVSYSGLVLYETTIDVVHPWGDGTHYWISSLCVNAA